LAKEKGTVNKQDIASNKLLALIIISFIAAMGLMFLYRAFTTAGRAAAAFNVTFVLCIVCAVATAAALFWRIRCFISKSDESSRTVTSRNLLRTCVIFLAASVAIYRLDVTAIKVIYVLLPLYVAIYFVLCVYGGTMGLITSLCAVNGVIFYVLNRILDAAGSRTGLYLTLFAVVCAVEFVVCFALNKNGKGGIFQQYRHDLAICTISAVLPIVFLVLWFFAGTPAMRYGLFGVCAWWVFCLIYYTVDLMRH